MRFITFYFSGTGNTKWAVNEFNNILANRGHQGVAHSIEDVSNKGKEYILDAINKAEYIGFANPIYGAKIPNIMREFIETFIEYIGNGTTSDKKYYFINTFGYVNGFGIFESRKLFKQIRCKLKGYANIQLCNNISFDKSKKKGLTEEKIGVRKHKAIKILQKLVDKLQENKSYIMGVGPQLIVGKLIRRGLKEGLKNNYKELSVNMNSCTTCMKCVNECPTHSMKYTDNKFDFLSTCTACMRCYNYCPTYSIFLHGKGDPQIYSRYRGIDT